MTIFYETGNNLYINMTNRCTCACEFCIRNGHDDMGDGNSLWLSREPSLDEIYAAFDKVDPSKYNDIVFCGFGEPTMRIYDLIEVAKYIKSRCNNTIRINTNGLADLEFGKPMAQLFEGVIDSVSISLNASNATKYNEICHPRFGEKSYDAMLKFASDCKKYVPHVTLSVVDCIGEEEVALCRKVADSVGINLRVRTFA